MQPRGLVTLGPGSWGYMGNPVSQLMSAMAQLGWKIAYSQGARNVWDRGTPDWLASGWRDHMRIVDGIAVYESGRLLSRWESNKHWDTFVLDSHCSRLRRVLRSMSAKPRAVVIYHPRHQPYLRFLDDLKIIFMAGDAYSAQPGWTKELEAMQRALVARADLIVAGSPTVADLLPDRASSRTEILLAAVDAPRFMARSGLGTPTDISDIPRPWIGYHGNLNAKINFALVKESASRNPNWHWILIGPVREEAMRNEHPAKYSAMLDCRALPNVHFLGPRPHDQISRYIVQMDALALIYDLDTGPWVRTAYPLKLHECLATGRPVVSAALELLKRHSAVVDLADSRDEWDAALRRAIYSGGIGTPDARRQVAAENSWHQRAADLDRWIGELP